MTINGLKWRLFFSSPFHPKLKTPWGTWAYGVCDKQTQEIYISDALPCRLFKEVLAHEIAHAVLHSHSVQLSYDDEELIAGWVGEEFREKGEC